MLPRRFTLSRSREVLLETTKHIYNVYEMRDGECERMDRKVVGRLRSTTEIIHSHFPAFDEDLVVSRILTNANTKSRYYGMSAVEIKRQWKEIRETASSLGTQMHDAIEKHILSMEDVFCSSVDNPSELSLPSSEKMLRVNIPVRGMNDLQRWQCWWTSFIEEINSCKFSCGGYCVEPEYLVYNKERNIAGTIDLLLINLKGEIILLDWKRSKEINYTCANRRVYKKFADVDDCNYEHYTMQLNAYRKIIESVDSLVIHTEDGSYVTVAPKVIYMALLVVPPTELDVVTLIPIRFEEQWTLHDLCS